MPRRSELIEDKINKLANNQDENQVKNVKSPTVQKLRGLDNKVNKLKQIFEDKSNDFRKNDDVKTQKKSNSPSQILKSLDCIRRSSSKSPKNKTAVQKIDRIVSELIEKEKEYIETIENGIKNYTLPILDPSKCRFPVPSEIQFQNFKLFGNINEIYNLHKSTILPQMIACENNVQKIAETFIKFIENDTFYCYIDYAIIHLHAKEMVASYTEFFKALQRSSEDRLGVQSFILQPIQKIPRYPLLFEEMIKELSSDMHGNKSSLASLCVAKKKLERFLIRLNQALKLNDIRETRELPITFQFETITKLLIEYDKDITKPYFFITPSFTRLGRFRTPVNVFDLGKFITIESFECREHEPYSLYFGEIFLFEKCLLYTKKFSQSDKSFLSYRDNFKFGEHTSIHLEQQHNQFTMGDIRTGKIVTFRAYSLEKTIQFYELIKNNHDRRKSCDSAFVDGSSISSVLPLSLENCTKKNADKKNKNNNNQGNEANMSENVTNQNIADEGNFGWSSDDEFACDGFEV